MKLQGAGNQTAGDKSVRALLNNYERGLPLVLLVDHKYTHFPYDLRGSNISYAVLGLYFIAHAWAEREIVGGKNVIRYKFAFHWIDNADPWWWEKDNSMDVAMATGSSDELVYPSEDGGLPRRTPEKDRVEPLSKRRPSRDTSLYSSCRQCGIDSPQVFAIGWTCLNATCVAFWTHAGTSPPEECVYNTQFLQLLPFPNNLREELKDIRPSEPMTAPRDGITTIKSFTRGFHCQNCGRLSCRFKWQQWECSNCGQTLQVQGKMRPANELRNIHSGIALKEYVNPFSGIRRLPRRTFSDKNISGEIDTFELPDGSGNIYHVKTPAMRLAPLDEIFLEYQKQADRGELLFRRWPLRSVR
ncbi:hypothetical protein E1B28_000745 [Marasmius oreades]|nr:uncharacterized protein E1B28_000745 [Marasmius oreades]KAG7098842.1 hypothetical protein E1B28_000745 [Marasmius oreades]